VLELPLNLELYHNIASQKLDYQEKMLGTNTLAYFGHTFGDKGGK